jgi:hypothetical protein
MKLRGLMGLTVMSAILCWASVGASKSAACAKAEQEVAAARRSLSTATREADAKAAAYQACAEEKGAKKCKGERQALRRALKAKRDAQAAYRYAVARAEQVCGG